MYRKVTIRPNYRFGRRQKLVVVKEFTVIKMCRSRANG